MTGPRPCSADEAVRRALRLVGHDGQYELGSGDYRPRDVAGVTVDLPWTTADSGKEGSDCVGFAFNWCYTTPRHREGFNHHSSGIFDVADDINCNSAIGDADTDGDLFERITVPEVGCLLVYPTIRLPNHPGMSWCGHISIVTDVSRAASWDPAKPRYALLGVAQCCGPNDRSPAVLATDGSIWDQHDQTWPLAAHRTVILRVRAQPKAA